MIFESSPRNVKYRLYASVFSEFRELYPTAVVITTPNFHILKQADGSERQTVYFKAEVFLEDKVIAVGHAGEFSGELGRSTEDSNKERVKDYAEANKGQGRKVFESKSKGKKAKVFEKVETAAIRRALLNLGIDSEEELEEQTNYGASSDKSDDIFDLF